MQDIQLAQNVAAAHFGRGLTKEIWSHLDADQGLEIYHERICIFAIRGIAREEPCRPISILYETKA